MWSGFHKFLPIFPSKVYLRSVIIDKQGDMMNIKKYVAGCVIAIAPYISGCGAANLPIGHSIDDCVKNVESFQGSEQKLSPEYRKRCALSIDPGSYADLWKSLPHEQKDRIAQEYFNAMSPDEKADVVKKCVTEKASGIYGSVKSGLSKAYGQLLDDVGDSNNPPFTLNVKEITTVDHQTLQLSYDQIKKFLKR